MAENRAAFSLRRRRSLGFSKCRWLRTSFRVPSRSIFFFNRRNARSTDSPFFNLISVNSNSLPLQDVQRSWKTHHEPPRRCVKGGTIETGEGGCQRAKNRWKPLKPLNREGESRVSPSHPTAASGPGLHRGILCALGVSVVPKPGLSRSGFNPLPPRWFAG